MVLAVLNMETPWNVVVRKCPTQSQVDQTFSFSGSRIGKLTQLWTLRETLTPALDPHGWDALSVTSGNTRDLRSSATLTLLRTPPVYRLSLVCFHGLHWVTLVNNPPGAAHSSTLCMSCCGFGGTAWLARTAPAIAQLFLQVWEQISVRVSQQHGEPPGDHQQSDTWRSPRP